MIIVRSPLRISLGGGGTDLPTYYDKHDGFVLSAAIDKYIYVTVNHSFRDKISLKYSKLEEVDTVDQIEHPIIREALKLTGIDGSFDLANLADIPAGTGLGSSGSFTVALLKALHTMKRQFRTREQLAEEAYHIERVILKQPVGKQDQYISAFGGITAFQFHGDSVVDVKPMQLSADTQADLEDNLLLFFTGYSRSASDILKEQDTKGRAQDPEMLDSLHAMRGIGWAADKALRAGDMVKFARTLNAHWELKKARAGMSNEHINDLYDLGMANGAAGGKLVGAGGGGFLMFYAEDKTRLRESMRSAGLPELRFRFDFEGVKVIHS